MLVHILVLNYNGRQLLAECLPSVMEAARASRHRCEVVVVDNSSGDGSAGWLASRFPEIRVLCRPNRGLSSLNDVVRQLESPVAVLLNNDIKLARDAVDPLVEPILASKSKCFMTAPRCWLFDGETYEGFKTAVLWRWGLVQATSLYPGHEHRIGQPGLTASAGAALAVRRDVFLELGGFDPIYLPGRIEDLDFCFRGWMAGYHGRYVPASVAYHRGMATFGRAFGASGCDHLALRNTLLFQWKNLRHPLHRVRHCFGIPARLALDLMRAPQASQEERWAFTRALRAALSIWPRVRAEALPAAINRRREREFFQRFHPRRMQASPGGPFTSCLEAGRDATGSLPVRQSIGVPT
jgi:GT2 family glycosyltransferase